MSIVMHLCVCLYVYNCMRKNLYLCETTMYLRYIYYFVVILLQGVSKGELHMLLNFGQDIQAIKGVHQNGFYSYFGGFKHLDCYYLIACCSLGPVLVI